MKLRAQLVAIGALLLGCATAHAANSGITTQQAYTAAPIAINLSGVAADAGVSFAFMASDAQFPLTGVLQPIHGGTGATSLLGTFVLLTPDAGQPGSQVSLIGVTDNTGSTPAATITGGYGGNEAVDLYGGKNASNAQQGTAVYMQGGGDFPNADGGLGGAAFLAFGTGATQSGYFFGGPSGGAGAVLYGGCGGSAANCQGTSYSGPFWGDGLDSYGAGTSSGIVTTGGLDGGAGITARGGADGGVGGQFYAGNSAASAILATGGTNAIGIDATGAVAVRGTSTASSGNAGISASGGTGNNDGLDAQGGAAGGVAINAVALGGNTSAISASGHGNGAGISAGGGATGVGGQFVSGATSGYGVTLSSGNAVNAPISITTSAAPSTTSHSGDVYFDSTENALMYTGGAGGFHPVPRCTTRAFSASTTAVLNTTDSGIVACTIQDPSALILGRCTVSGSTLSMTAATSNSDTWNVCYW